MQCSCRSSLAHDIYRHNIRNVFFHPAFRLSFFSTSTTRPLHATPHSNRQSKSRGIKIARPLSFEEIRARSPAVPGTARAVTRRAQALQSKAQVSRAKPLRGKNPLRRKPPREKPSAANKTKAQPLESQPTKAQPLAAKRSSSSKSQSQSQSQYSETQAPSTDKEWLSKGQWKKLKKKQWEEAKKIEAREKRRAEKKARYAKMDEEKEMTRNGRTPPVHARGPQSDVSGGDEKHEKDEKQGMREELGEDGEKKQLPNWLIQKLALQRKFPQGWRPHKRLSPDAMAGMRELHAQFPDVYTTPALAARFEVSPEAVRRILASKWRPTAAQESARQEAWEQRGRSVWTRLASHGVKPPRRWREMGIVDNRIRPSKRVRNRDYGGQMRLPKDGDD